MEKPVWTISCSSQRRLISNWRCLVVVMASTVGWLFFIFNFLSDIDQDKPPLGNFLLLSSDFQHHMTHSQQPPVFLYEPTRPVAGSHQNPDTTQSADLLQSAFQSESISKTTHVGEDPCGQRYVYVYDLPHRFNQGLIENCSTLSQWTNMCTHLLNGGFGPAMKDSHGVFPKRGWYATDQFTLEVIFHNRMKRYTCLTTNYSQANAFFVPFYAGLDFSRYLYGFNTTVRDADSIAIATWLRKQAGWSRMEGRDHFMVGGRITWDFRRTSDGNDGWGNKLRFLPGMADMTMLVLEASPWFPNDVGIPYPTYFHPKQESEIVQWQKRVSESNRSSLFCFAGAPRPGMEDSIRETIIQQCHGSQFCRLLEQCDYGEFNCRKPAAVMKLFEESVFCLQPPGDSLTRRSIFDSMLAGCIPVFFHMESAYQQYIWHLPQNYTSYSVFIPGEDIRINNVTIESVLRRLSPRTTELMREEVIRLIPRFIYADPGLQNHITDAFDISVQGVLDRVRDMRPRSLAAKKS